jgi:imidazolonepropionase-like amidohydrolase
MIKFLKILAAIILIIFITAIAGYVAWFQNTKEHTLQLNPADVYSDERGDDYLITHANIIDVENGVVLENRHLLIQNGRFERIFEGPIPDSLTYNYPVTDAGNRYLMPSLFDMHAHLNSGGLIPPDNTTRLMALEQFARYGVGTIFTLGGMGFNQEVTAGLIRKQQNRELVSPMIFAAGDILTSPGGYPIPFLSQMLGEPADELDLNEQGMIEVTDTTDLSAIIAAKRELGLHGVKVMVESRLGGATPESRISNAKVEQIAQIASEVDLPVFAHVTNQADFEAAIDMGVDVIAHNVSADSLTNAASYINKMREDSVYVTPTLLMSYRTRFLRTAEMLDDPFYLQYSSERTSRSMENWPIRQMIARNMGGNAEAKKQQVLYNISQLHQAGVPIMMGTDAGNATMFPGYSAHKELEFMADAGMSAAEVLRAATIVPARFLKMEETMGSISEGKIASLIMLDENPLENVSNTQTLIRVMLEGYWIE